ncbi:hypothetical protein [Deinococcus apachensis]|uniref:hypothetical protein n=1 Tax=Deinococcus apachensis TaxID=309886 RepID=UPI00036E14CE|nr:hypothetical protein [Deinococcus apachensis]
MTDPTPLSGIAPLLGVAFAAGAVTQLARQLARVTLPRLRQVAALSMAAGIAALTVTALLTVFMRPAPAPALLLAAACVIGWSGPGILTRLSALIERKLGLPSVPRHRWFRNGTRGTYVSRPSDHTEA